MSNPALLKSSALARFSMVAAAVLLPATPDCSRSTNIVWNGASGADMDTGANWLGGVVPSVGTPDAAQWNGTVAGNLSE